MNIRADLRVAAAVTPDEWDWVPSPQPGVERVMLDRVGDEVAVATSFVRYAPESRFPGHDHALGEEFIVLEGEFGDENGRYPVGSYVRNPPGSHHVPFSDPGCLIFVKLRQFQPDDGIQMVRMLDAPIPETGHEEVLLHEFGDERVSLIVAGANARISLQALDRPQELLVLKGSIRVDGQTFGQWAWVRRPAGLGIDLEAREPSRLFWKRRPAV
jgi:hypothetical protein